MTKTHILIAWFGQSRAKVIFRPNLPDSFENYLQISTCSFSFEFQ